MKYLIEFCYVKDLEDASPKSFYERYAEFMSKLIQDVENLERKPHYHIFAIDENKSIDPERKRLDNVIDRDCHN